MQEIPFMPKDPEYAYAYIAFQKFENLYEPSTALRRGTLFMDLDIPYEAYANSPIMNPFK